MKLKIDATARIIQLTAILLCLILLGGCASFEKFSYTGKCYKSNTFFINDIGYQDLYLNFITDSTCEFSYSFGLCFVHTEAKFTRDANYNLVLYSDNHLDSDISVTEYDRGENYDLTIKLGCKNINYFMDYEAIGFLVRYKGGEIERYDRYFPEGIVPDTVEYIILPPLYPCSISVPYKLKSPKTDSLVVIYNSESIDEFDPLQFNYDTIRVVSRREIKMSVKRKHYTMKADFYRFRHHF